MAVRVAHAIVWRDVSWATSSVRNLSKALAVLLLTVPRGTLVRKEISFR